MEFPFNAIQRVCEENFLKHSVHSTRERASEIKILKIELISRWFYFITTIINYFIPLIGFRPIYTIECIVLS